MNTPPRIQIGLLVHRGKTFFLSSLSACQQWGSASGARSGGALLPVMVFLWLGILNFSFPLLATDLDHSWQGVLADSVVKNRQFGTDIVYTYGPLGHYADYIFREETFPDKIRWELLLKTAAILVFWLIVIRLQGLIRWAFLGTLFLIAGISELSIPWALTFCVVILTLRHIEEGSRVAPFLWLLLLVPLALVKFTLFLVISFCVAGITLFWLVRGRRIEPALYAGLGVLLIMLLWKQLGQTSRGLDDYVVNSWQIASGFGKTMGIAPPLAWSITGLVAALCGLACLILSALPSNSAGLKDWAASGLKGSIPAAFLFLSWKHGFVRADLHVWNFFSFIPLFLTGLLFLFRLEEHRRGWWHMLASASLLGVVLAVPITRFGGVKLLGSIAFAGKNLEFLSAPDAALTAAIKGQKEVRNGIALDQVKNAVGRSTIDVFGDGQGVALLSKLNYAPRPIFQSFSAYTPSLINLNADFYRSDRRPHFVLAELNRIDGRFPALADSKTLATILYAYKPRFRDDQFLLLESTDLKSPDWKAEPLQEMRFKIGETVNLRSLPNSPVWAEVDVSPSLKGKLSSLLVRSEALQLLIAPDYQPDLTWKYRFFPEFGASGFLFSPLFLNTHDLVRHYRGDAMTRPVELTMVTESGKGSNYQVDVVLRLFALPPLPDSLKWAGKEAEEAAWSELGTIPSRTSVVGIPQVGVVGRQLLSMVPAPGEIQLTVPPKAVSVKGFFGMTSSSFVSSIRSDGARFHVFWQAAGSTAPRQQLYEAVLNPNRSTADREPREFSISLPPGASGGNLFLVTDPGLSGNATNDSTGWGGVHFQ